MGFEGHEVHHIKHAVSEAAVRRSSAKQVFLKILQYSQDNTNTQVFSCEYYEMFQNIFFIEHKPTP